MPAKHSRKVYVESGFYHLYNRGVEKRLIFNDEYDYWVFLNYLRIYLQPKDITIQQLNANTKLTDLEKNIKIEVIQNLNNYHKKIKLISFVLMPNHFHFLLQQTDQKYIKEFMKSIQVKYSMYFNKKYKRVGPLFQGKYKGILIEDENYFIHLSRYIHINPRDILTEGQTLATFPFSSYRFIIKHQQPEWLSTDILLSLFKNKTDIFGFKNYQDFVEKYIEEDEERAHKLSKLLID